MFLPDPVPRIGRFQQFTIQQFPLHSCARNGFIAALNLIMTGVQRGFGFALLLLGLLSPVARAASYEPANVSPPKPAREFRGAWVATVANIDWPSKRGLPAAEQKRQITDILDRALVLNLNAIILQVRPACDAMYPSKIEPWSEYLSGQQGKPPEPYYDPLQMWIDQAHRRGLELHAWFNPFRARHPAATTDSPGFPSHGGPAY